MKILTSGVLSIFLALGLAQSFAAKGSEGKGHRKQASSKDSGNPHANGQGSTDRDLGADRAREVGKGKKKGLYKDQHSVGDPGNDDQRKHKDKLKKEKVKRD